MSLKSQVNPLRKNSSPISQIITSFSRFFNFKSPSMKRNISSLNIINYGLHLPEIKEQENNSGINLFVNSGIQTKSNNFNTTLKTTL